ncbi:hypothetical protein BH11BAC4_BH11BAC4_05630 [soil metagenome]
MNSPLDEHIKKQLGTYKPDVPAHIWEKIAAEKDKRKPVGFWFNTINKNALFILLGLVLFGGATILYKNISATSENKKTIASDDKKTIDQLTGKITANNATAKTNEQANYVNAKSGQKQTANALSSTMKKEDAAEKDIRDHNKVNIRSSANTTARNKMKITAANTAVNETENSVPENAAAKSANSQKYFKGRSKIYVKNTPATFAEEETGDSNAENIVSENDNDLFLKRFLLNLGLLRAEKNITTKVKKPALNFINVPCPESEKDAAGNKRYFEIYGGPDYAFRSLTDTGNSMYLEKRKESTKFSSAFSVGIRYTKVFNNGMSFRTGINYSQINEKFKYAQGNIIQVIYIVDSNGDTTGSYTSSGTRYKTTFNKFRTIDVPLLIGYELGNGRWHANFNAGAIVNVYSWQKGDVLDIALKPISITTGKGSSPYQFKTNVGVGFLGSVSLYYKVSNRLHFLAEPYFRYNFTAASKADLTLKQKYSTAGLRLGVRIDF